MTKEEIRQALGQDFLERDGKTFTYQTSDRLPWEKMLPPGSAYSQDILNLNPRRILDEKDIVKVLGTAHRMGRRMLDSMDIPAGTPIRLGTTDSYTDGKSITVATVMFDDTDIDIPHRIDIFLGKVLHEALHVAYTDFSVNTRDNIVQQLTNIVEDERIEHKAGGKDGEDGERTYPGFINYLKANKTWVWGKYMEGMRASLESADRFTRLINAIIQFIRFPQFLSEKDIDEFGELLVRIKDVVKVQPKNTAEATEQAVRIKEIIKDEISEQVSGKSQKNKNNNSSGGKSSKPSSGDGSESEGEDSDDNTSGGSADSGYDNDEESSSKNGNPEEDSTDNGGDKNDSSGTGNEDKGNSSNDEKSDGGESDGKEDDGESGNADGDETDNEDEGNSSCDEKSDSGESDGKEDDGESGNGDSDESDDEEDDSESGNADGDESDNEDDEDSPSREEIDKAVKNALKIIENFLDNVDRFMQENGSEEDCEAIRQTPYIPQIIHGDAQASQDGKTIFLDIEKGNSADERLYDHDLAEVRRYIPAMRNILVANATTLKRNLKGMRNGVLDTGRLAEAFQGVRNVYLQSHEEKADRVAVCVLIDESGSMYGTKIDAARKTAILINEALGNLPNVDLFIYGHTADESRYGRNRTVIRSYRDRHNRDKKALGQVDARCNNADGFAILETAKRIREQTDAPVLMFVISDGQPASYCYMHSDGVKHTRKCVEEVTRMGFSPVQIAIDPCVESSEMFKHWVTFTDMAALPKELTTVIRNAVLKKTSKR